MEQREITTIEGSQNFPQNDNDVLELIEKIALQENKALKSANQFREGLRQVKVQDGKVLEQSVIKMAESRIFDKNATSREPLDPTLAVTYHNNFAKRQYQTTIRKSDIRSVIANKGLGVNEMTANILATLSEGADAEEYEKSINLIYTANIIDFATITGKKPKNMKGVLYMIRKAYNSLKHNNSNLTTAHQFKSATPVSDIRIAMSTDVSNLIDVTELADILNLEKEQLFGKINLFDTSYDDKLNKYMIFVYDINAFGRAERDDHFETERVARGEFDNAYKSVDDAFYHCGLFKAVKFDVTDAGTTAEAEILDDVQVVKAKAKASK